MVLFKNGVLSRDAVGTTVYDTGLLLVTAFFLPFLVHFIPSPGNIPAGAVLLPVFIPPLIGIYRQKAFPAFVCALLAPVMNHLLTGLPEGSMVLFLTMEVILFTAVLRIMVFYGNKYSMFMPPAAYIISIGISIIIFGCIPPFLGTTDRIAALLRAFVLSLPGQVILLVTGSVLRRIGNTDN